MTAILRYGPLAGRLIFAGLFLMGEAAAPKA